jgi:hypothetical protein
LKLWNLPVPEILDAIDATGTASGKPDRELASGGIHLQDDRTVMSAVSDSDLGHPDGSIGAVAG